MSPDSEWKRYHYECTCGKIGSQTLVMALAFDEGEVHRQQQHWYERRHHNPHIVVSTKKEREVIWHQ